MLRLIHVPSSTVPVFVHTDMFATQLFHKLLQLTGKTQKYEIWSLASKRPSAAEVSYCTSLSCL